MSAGILAPTIPMLCQLLDREEAACQSLLKTVFEERAAIRTLAVTEFHSINSKRMAILESLRSLAGEREVLVRQIAQLYGFDLDTTIHGLIDRLDISKSSDLRTRYSAFMAIAKVVRSEIKHNVVLIEGIRGMIDQALSAGAKIVPGLDVYGGDGQRAQAASANLLIHQQG